MDLEKLENEITGKVFFEGEGFEFGARDEEVLKIIETKKVCTVKYPGINRWQKFVEKTRLKM